MANDHHIQQRVFAGMAPRVHASAVPDRMAFDALDCDLGDGTLTAWRTDAPVEGVVPDPTAGVLRIEDCCVMQEPCEASIVDVPIGCDMTYATGILNAARTAPIPYPVQAPTGEVCAGDWTRLGLPCPPGSLDVAWLEERQTEQRVTARAFVWTWENELGQESVASLPTAVTVQDFDDRAVLSGWTWPSAEYKVTHVHIYELRAGVANANAKGAPGEGAFFRVATVTPTTNTLLFDPAVATLGPLYDNDLFQAPPADLRDIQFWNTNQLAGISGKYLYFSEPGFAHAWPDKYRVECFSTPLRFVAGRRFGYVLGCEAPELVDLTLNDQSAAGIRGLTRLRAHLPLVAQRGVAAYDDGVIYASTTGLVHLHEAVATVITEGLWSRQQYEAMNPPSMHLAVHEGFLYVSSSTGTWRIQLSSGTWGKADQYSITRLSVKPQAWYVTRSGALTYLDSTGVYQWNRGGALRPYRYESRTFTTGGRRGWAAVKVMSDTGDVKLTVMCGEHVLFSGRPMHNVPFRLPKGTTSTQHRFILEGTAEVYEVHLASGLDAISSA